MQHRHASVLADPLAVGDVDDPFRFDALHRQAAAQRLQVAGVILEQVIGPFPAPGVTLDTLDNAFRQVVVAEGQVVGLQQLQGKRHRRGKRVVRDSSHQLLRQALAIAQPSAAHQPLYLGPRQLTRGLRRERPLGPRTADFHGQLGMHRAIQAQRQRFHADATTAHHPLLEAIEQAGNQIVIFVQFPALLSHGDRRLL